MINLQKGQKISLTKDNSELNDIAVGLGWDERRSIKTLFGSNDDIDCDASAFLLRDGKLDNDDIVYYGNLKHPSKAVQHTGDNLTGEGEGDDETIYVTLDKIPNDVDRIVFVVNIYQAQSRKQHFGMIENAFIRVYDRKTNEELCKFNLTDDYKGMTALICGEIYRHDGEWKFNAIGEGSKAGSIKELAQKYN